MVSFPAPSTFPAPTGVFPPSPAAQDPQFGVNPLDPTGTNMYLGSAFASNTAQIQGANRAEQQAALMHAAQLASVNTALPGVLEDDPSQWTPESAAQQTDRALAKLSTVNPDAAESLARARTGTPDTSGGFFDSLKDLAGDILSPALSMGGQVLDIIGRTSYIVPNVIFDAVDGGEFNPVGAVGGAITGDVKHNFNSVFQEMGWEGDGIGGFIRSTVGLGLDIGADPLTWLIPAGAGAKLADTAVMGAKVAATRGVAERVAGKTVEELTGMGLGELATTVAGRSADDVEKMLLTHWDEVSSGMAKQGQRLGIEGVKDSRERALVAVNAAYEAGEAALRKEMWEVGDTTARLIGTRTMRTAVRDGLTLSDGLNIGAKDVKVLLEKMVKEGNGAKVYQEALAAGKTPEVAKELQKAAWKMGREFASVGGGFRAKVAIPFTQFRYISSPMASVTRFSPHATGQVFTRFFAGQSGMAGLVHEIAENGAPKTMLRDWMEGGWDNLSNLAKLDPEYAKTLETLRGTGKNLGSMLYSASEKVGGVTAAFNAGSKAARMGLPAYFAHQAAQEADNAKREFIRELLKKAGHDDRTLHADIQEFMGISMKPGKHTIDAEREWLVAKNLDYFPSDLDYTNPDKVEEWFRGVNPEFDQLENKVGTGEYGPRGEPGYGLVQEEHDKLERYRAILTDMQDVGAAGWSDKEKELLGKMRGRWDTARDEAGKWEARIGNVTMKLDEAMGLHASQVDPWKAGQGLNHPVTQGTYYMSGKDAASHRSLLNRGVDSDMAEATEDGVGIRVYSQRQSPDDVEVVIRGEDYIQLDADHNAQLPAGVVGGDAERTVADIKVENRRVMSENKPPGDWADDVLSPADMDQREAEMLTAVQRRDRTRARGVSRQREDGVTEVLVWDAENVKRTGDEFAIVGEHQGYMPRQLSDDAKKWVNGDVNAEDPQILLRVPFIRAEIERLTKGMTLDEANEHARAILAAHAVEWGVDPASIPAKVFIGNLAEADAKYIDALAHDIGSQILGQASQRLNRLGRIAPFMFGKAPRDQLYEWQMSKAWKKALDGADYKLKSAIARLKKKEAKYLESAHHTYGRQMDDAQEYALLMDEALSGRPDAIPMPTDATKWRKQGEAAAEARVRIEQARTFHTTRRAELDAEAAEIAQAKAQFGEATEAAMKPKAAAEAKKQPGQLSDEETAALLGGGKQAELDQALADAPMGTPERDEAYRAAKGMDPEAHPVPESPDLKAEQKAAAERNDEVLGKDFKDPTEAAPAETEVERYKRIKAQVDYYTTGSGKASAASVNNLDEAQAELSRILADLPETERNLLIAEDAMNAAQAKLNASNEKWDAIDQMPDQATEDRWDKRLAKEQAQYESAHQNYMDSRREAEDARAAAAPVETPAVVEQAVPLGKKGSPEAPLGRADLRSLVAGREEAAAAGDSLAEREAAKDIEAALGDGITEGQGVIVWKGKALENGQEVYIKPQGAKRAQRVTIEKEGYNTSGMSGSVSPDDAPGIEFVTSTGKRDFLPYDQIEDIRPPKKESFKPYGYDARHAPEPPALAEAGPAISAETVAKLPPNLRVSWKVEPDPDFPDAPFAVVDADGNNLGNYATQNQAEQRIYDANVDVINEMRRGAGVDPEAHDAVRDALRDRAEHTAPEDFDMPMQQIPGGQTLPGVNLKGADLEGEARGEALDINPEDVEYIATDDVHHNGGSANREGATTQHYTEQEWADYKQTVAEHGHVKPVRMIYHPEGRLDPMTGETSYWEVVDGAHGAQAGKEAGHDYLPVYATTVDGTPVKMSEVAPDKFRTPRMTADQMFDQQVDAGNVFFNKRTGSIVNRDGAMLEERRGLKRLRSVQDVEADLRRLDEEGLELDRAERALNEGLEYTAPDSAQQGARRPGETRTPAQRATYTAQQAQQKLKAAAQVAAKKTQEAKDVGRKLERLREQLEEASNAVNKAYAEARGVRAQMKPALIQVKTAGDMKGLMSLRIPGLEGHAMPEYIAEEWHQVLDHKGPGALASGWRQWVLGPWKRWATYRWPGFHVRNFFGAWFNNFLGGVELHDYSFAWKVNNFGKKDWANTAVDARDFARYGLGREFGEDALGKMTYGHVKAHLSGIGIGSANTRSVLEAADNVALYQNTVKSITQKNVSGARKGLRVLDDKMRGLGAGVEDFHRVAAWGGGMMAMGGDTWGARSFTMMRHGDYAELTNAEDHIRDLIPFYKWMRTNIPYQIRMMAENPGKLTAVTEKAKNYAFDVQGVSRQEAELSMPEYMKESFAVPIPSWVPFVGSKGEDALHYAVMDLPYADVYNGLNDYISAALPYGRNLLESYGFNKQAFTGKPLEGGKVRLSGFMGNPVMGKMLELAGVAEKGADGYFIDDRVENVLAGFPIYSKFRNFIEADEARVDARLGGVISTIAGVGIREADATQAELDFYYNEVEPLVQQYRDMGVQFPTTQDFARGADAVSPTGLPDPSALFGEGPTSGVAA